MVPVSERLMSSISPPQLASIACFDKALSTVASLNWYQLLSSEGEIKEE